MHPRTSLLSASLFHIFPNIFRWRVKELSSLASRRQINAFPTVFSDQMNLRNSPVASITAADAVTASGFR